MLSKMSWRRKVRHDVKKIAITSKISHGVKKFVIMSKISSWRQKVRHDVNKCVMTSKSYRTILFQKIGCTPYKIFRILTIYMYDISIALCAPIQIYTNRVHPVFRQSNIRTIAIREPTIPTPQYSETYILGSLVISYSGILIPTINCQWQYHRKVGIQINEDESIDINIPQCGLIIERFGSNRSFVLVGNTWKFIIF